MKTFQKYLSEAISTRDSVDIQDILNTAGIETKVGVEGIEFSYNGKIYEVREKKEEFNDEI
jgi:hypothetical protein